MKINSKGRFPVSDAGMWRRARGREGCIEDTGRRMPRVHEAGRTGSHVASPTTLFLVGSFLRHSALRLSRVTEDTNKGVQCAHSHLSPWILTVY